MTYALGVDLGTTYTAAAVVRDGRAEIVRLGNRSAVIPTVVFLKDAETLLVGEPALRRASSEPARFAREFKRRLGDPTPVLLGGSAWSAEALMARVLRWTIDAVTEREGGRPARLAVSHPANWGPYKLDLLAQAAHMAEAEVDCYIAEPEAAAVAYASTGTLAPGAVVAVYDLGGGTFDAAVLRKTEDGFDIVGQPEGIDRLGGVDFDQALVGHVAAALGGALDALPASDGASLAALARLRQECVEAKEALSSDSDTSVTVLLPGLQTEVRVTRAEFEALIRPTLADTVFALRRALRSADLEPAAVDAVLLVGGSSRIPLVAELVGGELGRPVAVDADPKHSVAIGAALTAAGSRGSPGEATAPPDVPLRSTATSQGTGPWPARPRVRADDLAGRPEDGPVTRPRIRSAPPAWIAMVVLFVAFTVASPSVIAVRQASGTEKASSGGSSVEMAELSYRPPELVVDKGTEVTFENRDLAPHTVTEADGELDSGVLGPGDKFSVVVDRPLEYFCTLHRSMRAKISLSG